MVLRDWLGSLRSRYSRLSSRLRRARRRPTARRHRIEQLEERRVYSVPLVVHNETIGVEENTSISFNVLLENGGSPSISGNPQHGTATISGTKINYTPTSGFTGVDTIGVSVSSGDSSGYATITLDVFAPTSQAPSGTVDMGGDLPTGSIGGSPLVSNWQNNYWYGGSALGSPAQYLNVAWNTINTTSSDGKTYTQSSNISDTISGSSDADLSGGGHAKVDQTVSFMVSYSSISSPTQTTMNEVVSWTYDEEVVYTGANGSDYTYHESDSSSETQAVTGSATVTTQNGTNWREVESDSGSSNPSGSQEASYSSSNTFSGSASYSGNSSASVQHYTDDATQAGSATTTSTVTGYSNYGVIPTTTTSRTTVSSSHSDRTYDISGAFNGDGSFTSTSNLAVDSNSLSNTAYSSKTSNDTTNQQPGAYVPDTMTHVETDTYTNTSNSTSNTSWNSSTGTAVTLGATSTSDTSVSWQETTHGSSTSSSGVDSYGNPITSSAQHDTTHVFQSDYNTTQQGGSGSAGSYSSPQTWFKNDQLTTSTSRDVVDSDSDSGGGSIATQASQENTGETSHNLTDTYHTYSNLSLNGTLTAGSTDNLTTQIENDSTYSSDTTTTYGPSKASVSHTDYQNNSTNTSEEDRTATSATVSTVSSYAWYGLIFSQVSTSTDVLDAHTSSAYTTSTNSSDATVSTALTGAVTGTQSSTTGTNSGGYSYTTDNSTQRDVSGTGLTTTHTYDDLRTTQSQTETGNTTGGTTNTTSFSGGNPVQTTSINYSSTTDADHGTLSNTISHQAVYTPTSGTQTSSSTLNTTSTTITGDNYDNVSNSTIALVNGTQSDTLNRTSVGSDATSNSTTSGDTWNAGAHTTSGGGGSAQDSWITYTNTDNHITSTTVTTPNSSGGSITTTTNNNTSPTVQSTEHVHTDYTSTSGSPTTGVTTRTTHGTSWDNDSTTVTVVTPYANPSSPSGTSSTVVTGTTNNDQTINDNQTTQLSTNGVTYSSDTEGTSTITDHDVSLGNSVSVAISAVSGGSGNTTTTTIDNFNFSTDNTDTQTNDNTSSVPTPTVSGSSVSYFSALGNTTEHANTDDDGNESYYDTSYHAVTVVGVGNNSTSTDSITESDNDLYDNTDTNDEAPSSGAETLTGGDEGEDNGTYFYHEVATNSANSQTVTVGSDGNTTQSNVSSSSNVTSDQSDGFTESWSQQDVQQMIYNVNNIAAGRTPPPFNGTATQIDTVSAGQVGNYLTSTTTAISDQYGNSSTEIDNDTLTQTEEDTGNDQSTATSSPDANGTSEDESDNETDNDTGTVYYTDNASGTFDSTSGLGPSSGNSTTIVVEHDNYAVSSSGTDTVSSSDAPSTSPTNVGTPGGSATVTLVPFTDTLTGNDRGTDAFAESTNSTITTSVNYTNGDYNTEVDTDHYSATGSDSGTDGGTISMSPNSDGQSEDVSNAGGSNGTAVITFTDISNVSIHAKQTTADDSDNVTVTAEDDTDALTTTGIDNQSGGDGFNTNSIKVALSGTSSASSPQSTDNSNETDDISDSFSETVITAVTVNITMADGDSSAGYDNNRYTRWGSDDTSNTANSSATPSGSQESVNASSTSNDQTVFDFHDEDTGSFSSSSTTSAGGVTTVTTASNIYGTTSDGQDTQSGNDSPVMSPALVNTDGSGGSAAQTFSDTVHGEDDESNDYTSTNIESVTVTTNDGAGNTTTTIDTDNYSASGSESSSDTSVQTATPTSDSQGENAGGSDASGGGGNENWHDSDVSSFVSTQSSTDANGVVTATVLDNTDTQVTDGTDSFGAHDSNSFAGMYVTLSSGTSNPTPNTDNSGNDDESTDSFTETVVATTDITITNPNGDSSHEYDEDDYTRTGTDSSTASSSENDNPSSGGSSEDQTASSSVTETTTYSFHDVAHGTYDSTVTGTDGSTSVQHNTYSSTTDGTDTSNDSDTPTITALNVPLADTGSSPLAQLSDTPSAGDSENDDFNSTNSFTLTVTTNDGAGNTTTTVGTDTISQTGIDDSSASETDNETPGSDGASENISTDQTSGGVTSFAYTEVVTQTYDATSATNDGSGNQTSTVTHSGSTLTDSGTQTGNGHEHLTTPTVNLALNAGTGSTSGPPVQFTDDPGGNEQTTDGFSTEYHSTITTTQSGPNGNTSTQVTHENYTATGTDSESATSDMTFSPDADGADEDESDTETDDSVMTYWFTDVKDGTFSSLVNTSDDDGSTTSTQTDSSFTTTATGSDTVADDYSGASSETAYGSGPSSGTSSSPTNSGDDVVTDDGHGTLTGTGHSVVTTTTTASNGDVTIVVDTTDGNLTEHEDRNVREEDEQGADDPSDTESLSSTDVQTGSLHEVETVVTTLNGAQIGDSTTTTDENDDDTAAQGESTSSPGTSDVNVDDLSYGENETVTQHAVTVATDGTGASTLTTVDTTTGTAVGDTGSGTDGTYSRTDDVDTTTTSQLTSAEGVTQDPTTSTNSTSTPTIVDFDLAPGAVPTSSSPPQPKEQTQFRMMESEEPQGESGDRNNGAGNGGAQLQVMKDFFSKLNPDGTLSEPVLIKLPDTRAGGILIATDPSQVPKYNTSVVILANDAIGALQTLGMTQRYAQIGSHLNALNDELDNILKTRDSKFNSGILIWMMSRQLDSDESTKRAWILAYQRERASLEAQLNAMYPDLKMTTYSPFGDSDRISDPTLAPLDQGVAALRYLDYSSGWQKGAVETGDEFLVIDLIFIAGGLRSIVRGLAARVAATSSAEVAGAGVRGAVAEVGAELTANAAPRRLATTFEEFAVGRTFGLTSKLSAEEEARIAWELYQRAAASEGIIIGRGDAPIKAVTKGWDVLRRLDAKYTDEINRAWIDGAAHAGKPIRLVTPFQDVVRGTNLWDEILEAISQQGNLIVK